MSLNFVQGDTAPDITSIIHEEDEPDQAVDLTSCPVRFQMKQPDDKRYQVRSGDHPRCGPGSVSYSWGPNDLSRPGHLQRPVGGHLPGWPRPDHRP